MKAYGYICISSAKQNVDCQMSDLQAYNIPIKSVFIDKKSGKDFNRPNYQALLKKLQRGDLLYIKSIDQLGRNADEVQQQWYFLTQKKKINIFVIDTPCLDTRASADFLHEFINHLFLYVLSFLAKNERSITRKRQAEGIKAAKQRGVRFGRARKELPKDFMNYCELYLAHKLTVREAAALCGMAKSTFADAVKRAVAEGQVKNIENKSANERIEAQEKSVQPKEKIIALSAHPKSKQSVPKAAERENNGTEFLTSSSDAPDIPFYGIKETHKTAPNKRKKSRKHKKTGRK